MTTIDPASRQGGLAALLILLVLSAATGRGEAQVWVFHGPVAEGGQIDAVRGPGDTIHLISSGYYVIDASGAVILEEDQGDERQGSMDFPPAIAVCDDGSVHIVTRHGGDWDTGHDIRYRRRSAAGSWDRDYMVGSPWKRNYVVGIGCADGGHVAMFYSEGGDDVWGDLHLWEAGDASASDLGRLSDIWRSDGDARMRGDGGKIFLVSGKPDDGGSAYFLHAAAGAGLRDQLDASKQEHTEGSGRRGFPDLYLDPAGSLHLTYGAQYTAFYNSYTFEGSREHGSDIEIMSGLNDWHLSTGLSAVAASDDGSIVVAVALRSDGSQGAGDADLFWTYSEDGGTTWNSQQDMGRNTDGGEGRCRPRLAAIGRTFYLLYNDRSESGISLATLDFGTTGEPDGEAVPETVTDQDTIEETGEPTDAEAAPEGEADADAAFDPDAAGDPDGDGGGDGSVEGGCGCVLAG